MDGWKTKIAGSLMIAGAACGLALHFITEPDVAGSLTIEQAATAAIAGMAVLGLGGKLQKIIDAIKK